ncbi:MAG: universal stress protein [Dehalococcoidia bacterium]
MIAITTDGSERSTHVFPHAAKLAAALGWPLGLLHVLGPDDEPGQVEDDLRNMMDVAGIEAARAVIERTKEEDVASAILRAANELGARILAMDSRGHGALHHVLSGSVAMSVIGRSTIPLLLTGPKAEVPVQSEAFRVLVTADRSPASEGILSALQPLLSSLQVTLLMVFVPELADRGDRVELASCHQYLQDVQNRLLSGLRCDVVVKRAGAPRDVAPIIVNTAMEVRASAIAMSTRGHAARQHVIFGSTAADVLGQSPLPLLLARQ